MGSGHQHDGHANGHNHGSGGSTRKLRAAFFLNAAFTVVELVGGLYVNSVSIVSDAVHDLGDSLSLGTAWYLQHKSGQAADRRFSFGYARFSLLGALINSIVLIGGSVYVIYEAIQRFVEPEASDATGMLVFAVLGVVVNGYAAWRMSGGRSLNERVVSWHLLEDVLGWVAVLIVAVVLQFYESPYLDPALSLFITAYILWGVVRRLRETLFVFLQGTPEGVDLAELERRIAAVPHVASLHHTHIWSLEGERHVFTTHVRLEGINRFDQILDAKHAIKTILAEYPLEHYTVETELDGETCALAQEPG